MANQLKKFVQKLLSFFPAGSLKQRFARNTLWSIVGAVAAQAANLVASIILSRLLGKTVFGELGIINSTVGTLGLLAGISLSSTSTKYIAQYRSAEKEKAGAILGFSILAGCISSGLAGLLLFIFARPLSLNVLNSTTLAPEFMIASLTLFFTTVNGIQLGALAGLEDFRAIARINIFKAVFTLVFFVAGGLLGGLLGVIIGMGIANVFIFITSQLSLRNRCNQEDIKITFKLETKELPILYRFSLPSFLSDLLVAGINWLGNTMLVNQTNGYAEMGIFIAAYQWRTAALFLPGIMTQVSIPLLSNLYGTGQLEKFRKVVFGNLAIALLVATIIALPIMLFSKSILGIYGTGYADQYATLIIILVTVLMISLSRVIGAMMVSLGKLWHLLFINAIWVTSYYIVCRIFIHRGAMGLALANLIAYGVQIIGMAAFMICYFSKHSLAQNKS